jgi:pimeloyl-ACP methyl ester carboxylesterase
VTNTAPNIDGEVEVLWTGKTVVHHFVEAAGLTWHYLESGTVDKPTIVFLHGFPECAYAWHNQLTELADQYRCIAVDLKGYGQSDHRLDSNYDYAGQASELVQLFDELQLETFYLVSHDRGSVISDHLGAIDGMNQRITGYVRMQQSGNKPHSEPRPPHEILHSALGVELIRSGQVHEMGYSTTGDNPLVVFPVDEKDLARLAMECARPGVAEGMSASFVSAGFDKELDDRMNGLFEAMTMPVLFLQGALDPGQQPSEYETVTGEVADGYLQFIEAGHFLHLEKPEAVSAAIREFLVNSGR